MKTILYYFSGTGNTLTAARKIADGIGNCEAVPIVREMQEGRFHTNAERIIFMAPLYFFSYPKIVLDFIQKFEFSEKSEIICVITRGFKPMGAIISHTKKILKRKGRKLSMGFYIDMPSNDVTMFNVFTPEKQRKLLTGSEAKIKSVIYSIISGKSSFDPEPFAFMRYIRYKPAYLNHLKTVWKEFYTQDSCNGCGTCAGVCPLRNITMENRQPLWNENCQLCEACINYCPKKAIQIGGSTVKKGRYVHPDVSFREIAAQRGTK